MTAILRLFPILLLLLSACSAEQATTPELPASSVPAPVSPTPTHFQPPETASVPEPTATSVPLALVVNGVAITLDEFNLALQRLHAGLPEASSEEAIQRVTDEYIEQILLAQAAEQEGFELSDADFAARLAELTEQAGGPEALAAWMESNFYTPEIFERDLRRSIAAAWMRDRILATVPEEAEQVRARHIRVLTREEAEAILAQLNSGTDFDLLLAVYDPEGLGELGWFPRGVLYQPAIEEAAFSLEVGEYSGVVETPVGFHIVQVTDRDPAKPLTPDARWILQTQALEAWLQARREGSEIEILR